MLNTIVADAFCEFADILEKSEDFESDVRTLIKDTISAHRRIIFNGDGYSDRWKEEAKSRGLLNLPNTAVAIPLLSKKENVELFARHGVFSETEVKCREEIRLENYCKTLHIEALTLLEMIKRDVIPAISSYTDTLCSCICRKRKADNYIDCSVEETLARRISEENSQLLILSDKLKSAVEKAKETENIAECALYYHDTVLSLMNEIRAISDSAESEIKREFWPYPTYDDLLFKI